MSEEVLFYFPFNVPASHEVLHDAVFERVVGDYHQSSAGAEQGRSGTEHVAEGFHLAVHLYAQGLKQAGQVFLLALTLEKGGNHLGQLLRGGDGPRGSALGDGGGNLSCVVELAVVVENVGQPVFIVVSHDVGCGLSRAFVHPHVERSVLPEGEPAPGLIEMVA